MAIIIPPDNRPWCALLYKISLYAAEKKERRQIDTKNVSVTCVKLIINNTSPKRLNVKGPPKLATINKNQKIDKEGIKLRPPLLRTKDREWDRSYIRFARANIPDEHTPCAIMIIIPPASPHIPNLNTPAIIKAMCTTEEYAIITLISLITVHRTPKTPPPTNANLIVKHATSFKPKTLASRTKPYPPNFNITPAKTIDPATGASTWALGSQRCTPHIGNFTRKAKTMKKYIKGLPNPHVNGKKNSSPWKTISWKIKIITKKGSDENKV